MQFAVDGRTAYAYTGGKAFDASLPCVVFIHGAMHDHSVWGLQSRALAHRGHAVLAVDLPGHGRSAGPAKTSVEDAAAWIVELLLQAGVQRCALAGHSMGSLIALEVAALLGDRATHLALLATALPMKVSPVLLALAADDVPAAIDMVNALSHSSLAAKPSSPSPGFWLQGANRALMRKLQRKHDESGLGNLFLNDFMMCDTYARGVERAAQVRCRATVLIGRHDRMTLPSAANSLIAALNAECVTLEAGHALMSEVPDAVLQTLTSRFS